MDAPLNVAVIVGSTRPNRHGGDVADWFVRQVGRRDDLTLDIVDLASIALPTAQSASPPRSQRYEPAVAAFAARIERADAFVFVVPEYNHGYPAVLKHAIDAVYLEWAAKPSAFVSYGGAYGGVRAVEQLRQVLPEVHGMSIRDAVAVPHAYSQFGGSAGDDDKTVIGDVKPMLDSLVWWGRALRAARARSPYAA